MTGALGAVMTFLIPPGPALAESAYCSDLRAQIARTNSGSAAHSRAVAGKLANELNRASNNALRLGCDRQQFLFFGDPPPPQCAQLNARIAQLRANLGALQQGGNDGALKQSLIARYDSQCRDGPVQPSQRPAARGFFEEFFGAAPPTQLAPRLREVPLEDRSYGDSTPTTENHPDGEEVFDDGHPTGGAEAICVRQCDGGFFPVSYSARRDNLDDLNTLCKALCPGAEASLYTKSLWKDLDSAISIEGDSYSDHPNAFKFQKTSDASCSCKPPGQNWAEALGEAERILAQTNSKDTVVTAEQAEQLSRPMTQAPARGGRHSSRRDTPAPGDNSAATPTPMGGPASANQEQGVMREVTGPDGVKRRVRVVAPAL